MSEPRTAFHEFPEEVKREMAELGMDLDARKSLDLKTRVGPWVVSTVKLVCDHSFGHGPPIWHETMVFCDDDTATFGSRFMDIQRRYYSEAEARAGHEVVVAHVKGMLGE